ncbi:MAG: ABC transporter transmembrane domain-containing protein [Pseudomonadota bacterium]
MIFTAVLFPVQYLTLEIPKTIINGAIGSETPTIPVLSFEFSRLELLWLLCAAFLVAVLTQGVMKMRLNTMKGILSERMLRRFRYMLTTRLFRFPQTYFRRTSQGELVSMVTSESETLGGMMGDAISLPLFQAGQMLTILTFLIVQSPLLGLAASALIPLQAWLIPKMQRKINLLARERVQQVRKFSTLIGESADGAVHLRRTGGLRYWKARLSDRLGKLFLIRFEIFQRKFFMKFVNNLITQLTPLMFYSLGGYLVITGQLTIGALVAALAAHKDLAAPWKELLTYYNQIQETGIRYKTIIEKFDPEGMIDETVFDAESEPNPSLKGEIAFDNVTIFGEDGAPRLKDVSLSVPAGASVGVAVEGEDTRRTLANLLTREVLPTSGTVKVAGHDLSTLPQTTISERIGYAGGKPFVLQGTLSQNAFLPRMLTPATSEEEEDDPAKGRESQASGNSMDPLNADWLHDEGTGRERWLDLTQAMDVSGGLLELALAQPFDGAAYPALSEQLVALRDPVAKALAKEGLEDAFHRFDPERFNLALPVAVNLFFAIPTRPITTEVLTGQLDLPALLRNLDLQDEMIAVSGDIIDLLQRIFGRDGTKHPMFQRLGLDPDIYDRCLTLLPQLEAGATGTLTDDDIAHLLLIPFSISAERIGVGFTDELKDRIVALRPQATSLMDNGLDGLFSPLTPDTFTTGLSLLENILYGKIADGAGPKAGRIREVITDELRKSKLAHDVYALLYDLPTDIGGANLSAEMVETLEVTRAAIKSPDILILDRALASLEPDDRRAALARVRGLLPDATLIVLEARIEDQSAFDTSYEIRHSQLQQAGLGTTADEAANPVSIDLTRKIQLLEDSELFSGLGEQQLRLLAFGARWYDAEPGTVVFRMGDEPTDGAYVIADGEADLYIPEGDNPEVVVATAEHGVLIGELALINKSPRALSMRAKTKLRALRLGSEEFLSVVEADVDTAVKLLQVVAGYAQRSAK